MIDLQKTKRRVSFTLQELVLLEAGLVVFESKSGVDLRRRIGEIIAETQEPEYQRIVAAYRSGVPIEDGEVELDDDAEVSIGDDPGAYVMVWKWVSSEDAGLCRTCSSSYDGCGDGWDGECPDCADKTEAALEEDCDRCGADKANKLVGTGELCNACHEIVQGIPDEDEGQDRESYSDDQDRNEYSVSESGFTKESAWKLK